MTATLRGLLYPLWDAGWQVGHWVGAPKDAIERSGRDFHAATTLLTARFVAGERALFDELIDRRARWLSKERRALARRIWESFSDARRSNDRAGWLLAPDIKDDVGGLRDAHRVEWMSVVAGTEAEAADLSDAAGVLFAAREGLHAETKRKLDRLRMHLQGAVARRMGFEGDDAADVLMAHVHRAARAIEHRSALSMNALVDEVLGGPRRSGSSRAVADRVRLEDGVLTIEPTGAGGPTGADAVRDAVRLLELRAQTGRALSARATRWLSDSLQSASELAWDGAARDLFFSLLAGPDVVPALEALDHANGWRCLLPEWSQVRARPQHDPYHRYTVDYHLFVTAQEVGRAVDEDEWSRRIAAEAGDLSTLRLAALIHDIGKGSGVDHSVAGAETARAICARLGLGPDATRDVTTLVRHHLVLVDTATRRDLDDGAVISSVAETVGDPRLLRLLYLLTVADARATGPDAWTPWKASLVRELFGKVLVALETGEIPARSDVVAKAREVEAYDPALAGRAAELLDTLPPSYLGAASVYDMADDLRLLSQAPHVGEVVCRVHGDDADGAALTVCVADRPGTLARTAGVLALNGLSVVTAQAFSTSTGFALERFVTRGGGQDALAHAVEDLHAAYEGRLAVQARVEKKIADYAPPGGVQPDIRLVRQASENSTVVEVRAPDVVGLLYALATAIAELDLDIHVAKIDTLGHRVVDVFYVRDARGEKLSEEQEAELVRSIRHRLTRLFS